jgi:K+-sensing histidine kinase KdpD
VRIRKGIWGLKEETERYFKISKILWSTRQILVLMLMSPNASQGADSITLQLKLNHYLMLCIFIICLIFCFYCCCRAQLAVLAQAAAEKNKVHLLLLLSCLLCSIFKGCVSLIHCITKIVLLELFVVVERCSCNKGGTCLEACRTWSYCY